MKDCCRCYPNDCECSLSEKSGQVGTTESDGYLAELNLNVRKLWRRNGKTTPEVIYDNAYNDALHDVLMLIYKEQDNDQVEPEGASK